MRIAIVGAGGVGGLLAGLLARAGRDEVVLIARGAAREICVFKSPSNGEAKDLRVVLIGADGSEKAQSAEGVKVSRDADGFDRVVFTISARDVEAGLYGLKVSIGPTASLPSSLRVQ